MVKTVFGIFMKKEQADDAMNHLESIGYKTNEMSVIMKEERKGEEMSGRKSGSVGQGAVTGMETGAVIGGIAGLVVGIGAIFIPGLGALLISGPIATALGLSGAVASTASGVVAGAVAGGLIGALMRLGVSREKAEVYEQRIREGGILLTVPASGSGEGEVKEIMKDHGATDIHVVDFKTNTAGMNY